MNFPARYIRFTNVPAPIEFISALTKEEGGALTKLAEGKIVLEMGAELGISTIALAQKAQKVYSVDWQGGDECAGDRSGFVNGFRESEIFTHGLIHNLYRTHVIHSVIPIIGRFEDVLPLLQPNTFDFIFHDGDHSITAVQRDTELARPLLKRGGVFAWHDYGREGNPGVPFGVTQYVDALARSLGVEVGRAGTLAWVSIT